MFANEEIAPAERRRYRNPASSVPLCWLAALALGGLTPGAASAQGPGPGRERVRNVVYVKSNDPAGNAIFAFRRHDDGSLTPLAGSPFPAGGTGITPTFALGPFNSDQNIIIDSSYTLLFAVNSGSDGVAVFWINGNGSLSPVNGSPFPSGGSNPVSVGLSGDDVLCVVNQDQDPGRPGLFLPDYASFRVTKQGRLIPIPTFFVDAGASPSQALVSPDGGLMVRAEFLGGPAPHLPDRAKRPPGSGRGTAAPSGGVCRHRRACLAAGAGGPPDQAATVRRFRDDQPDRDLPL